MFRTLLATLPRPNSTSAPLLLRFASSSSTPPSSPATTPKERPPGPKRTPPKNHQRPPLPPLNEAEIEEDFLRGRGPGGQVINKSSILVSLLHVPTGLRVKCQETRSRESNRLIARKLMQVKLDALLHGKESRQEQKWARERSKKEARKRKGRRNAAGRPEEEDGRQDAAGEEFAKGSSVEESGPTSTPEPVKEPA